MEVNDLTDYSELKFKEIFKEDSLMEPVIETYDENNVVNSGTVSGKFPVLLILCDQFASDDDYRLLDLDLKDPQITEKNEKGIVEGVSLLKNKEEFEEDPTKQNMDSVVAKRKRGRPRVLFKKIHFCDVCHKVFSRKTHLTTHLRIHSNEKPFSCRLCLKKFRDNSVLVKHIRVHTKDKPYKCDICQKAFSQKGNMTRHTKQHSNEKPFICDACGIAFANKSHLQRHFRIHSNEKPFNCELCQKVFRQKCHLIRHVVVHANEKLYNCDICGKKFRQKQHVVKHQKTHFSEIITEVLFK